MKKAEGREGTLTVLNPDGTVNQNWYKPTVNCLYAGQCTDVGFRCSSCANNPNKSYYQPRDYWPWYPQIPYVQPWDYESWRITCDTQTTTSTDYSICDTGYNPDTPFTFTN